MSPSHREPLSALGDGTEWIWTLQARRFTDAEPVLDVFHAVEHLAELSRAAWGDDGASSRAWLDGARRALVADGWAGVCQFVAQATATVANPAALQEAYPAVANYLLGHRNRMQYAARLARGQSIGSGLIEGTIKKTSRSADEAERCAMGGRSCRAVRRDDGLG